MHVFLMFLFTGLEWKWLFFGLGTIITVETLVSKGSLIIYIFIFYVTVLYIET